jgi:uncharacterized cupredoxin-like copper-binding protein
MPGKGSMPAIPKVLATYTVSRPNQEVTMSRERMNRVWTGVLHVRRAPLVTLLAMAALFATTLTIQAQSATPPAGACGGAAGTATAGSSTPSAGQCVEIGMMDIYFTPNLVTIPANTPVTIMLPNKGATMHNFSITDHKNPDLPNLNISVDVNPGETKSVEINAQPGTYYFFCNVPGHEAAGMFGYLEVKPDATISASSATVTPRAG